MTIIAFAGSNSGKSINRQLIDYVVENFAESAEIITLTDYEVPIYKADLEVEEGIPEATKQLEKKLQPADKLIISVAENNGNLTAFFKNQLDWLSRHNRGFFKGKEILLLSTSPGPGGGANALAVAEKTLPFFAGKVVGKFSVKTFLKAFKDKKLIDQEIHDQLQQVVEQFLGR